MPRAGPSMSTKLSRIQVRSGNDLMRRGGTSKDGPTRPSSPIGVTMIGTLIVNVCTEAVWSRIALVPGKFNPRSLLRCESATTTSSRTHSGCHKRTRRYDGFMGTLAPLWQRQNDVNCALAAQRRTTAASPTRAAANPTLHTFRCPVRFHTLCVPRAGIDFKRGDRRSTWYSVLGIRSESDLSLVHPSTEYQEDQRIGGFSCTYPRTPSVSFLDISPRGTGREFRF